MSSTTKTSTPSSKLATLVAEPKRQLKSPSPYPCEQVTLHTPPLEEVARVLEAGLKPHFAQLSVQVVSCPDLTAKPFNLIRPGLSGGQEAVLDVGGPAFLMPKPQLERAYDLQAIADQLHLNDHVIIGAAAGPYHRYGHNSEFIANVLAAQKKNSGDNNNCGCETNESRCVMVITPATNEIVASTGNHHPAANQEMHVLTDKLNSKEHDSKNSTQFSILGNFYASRGEAGQVLCIKAKHRTSPSAADFTEAVQAVLAQHYGKQPVALGGTFAVHKGRVRVHVMPDFLRDKLLKTEQDLDEWLQYFTVDAPISFHGEIVSYDPGYNLRTKHAHGYGPNGGGHYHNDESPEEVEYEAYYNVAKTLYRVDRPDAESDKAAGFGHD